MRLKLFWLLPLVLTIVIFFVVIFLVIVLVVLLRWRLCVFGATSTLSAYARLFQLSIIRMRRPSIIIVLLELWSFRFDQLLLLFVELGSVWGMFWWIVQTLVLWLGLVHWIVFLYFVELLRIVLWFLGSLSFGLLFNLLILLLFVAFFIFLVLFFRLLPILIHPMNRIILFFIFLANDFQINVLFTDYFSLIWGVIGIFVRFLTLVTGVMFIFSVAFWVQCITCINISNAIPIFQLPTTLIHVFVLIARALRLPVMM